ncbi:aspartate kinase [Halobacteriovorax sp.]|uniref:aspartate kinase n=1 Tax=Halobacteriovorax sp. TaxID=2020862 RepID=UPI00356B3015
MKIYKFGGSSVKDATAIKRVSNIILSQDRCGVVVVSATKNTTNELETIAKSSSLSEENLTSKLISTLFDRHREIARDLELDIELSIFELETELRAISSSMKGDGEVSPSKMDSLYSFGERLSSLILSRYLQRVSTKNVILKDVREVLITNDHWNLAAPLIGETSSAIEKWGSLTENDLVITQGFIGSTTSGQTTTLGREGSDFSATLLGEVLHASEVTIWTDVAGVATCDPRIIDTAKFIENLSYKHAASLAHFGAKVLFERTLEPAIRKKFPVLVRSTLSPSEVGTSIHELPLESGPVGIALENNILTVVGEKLLSEDVDFPFNCLKSYEIERQTDEFISLKFSNEDTGNAVEVLHAWVLKSLHS